MDDRRLADELSSLETATPVSPLPALPMDRRRPLLWVPAGLALVAGILIGPWGAQLLPQEKPPAEFAGVSPRASTEPLATSLAWSATHYPGETGPSYLFVARDRVIASPAGAYSYDGGETWIEAPKRGRQEGDSGLGEIAEHGGRLVSLGSRPAASSGSDADRRAVIWTSDDGGESWSRAPTDSAPDVVGDTAATDAGFVVIGSRTDPYPSEVWRSADGLDWQRVNTEGFDKAIVTGLAWNGDVLVAVGVVVTDDSSSTYVPMAWSSTDGTTWDAHTLATRGVVSALAMTGGGFIAAGPLADGTLGVWRSTDGVSWSSATYFDHWERVTGLAAGPLGVVVAGQSDVEATGAWNNRLPYVHSLLAFIPPSGEATVEDDLPSWPNALAALPDRFLAVADDCPPYADCFVSHSMLIGRAATLPPSPTSADPTAHPTVRHSAEELVGRLNGDAHLEAGCAWVTDENGTRWEVRWPAGYEITFPTGDLPVLHDPAGAPVAQAGDQLVLEGGPDSDTGGFCMVADRFFLAKSIRAVVAP